MKRRYIIIGLITLFSAGIPLASLLPSNDAHIVLTSPEGDRVRVRVELADTVSRRRKGLMFRKELALDHGMLFLFKEEKQLSFWMKNTFIPLDILFFSAEQEFISSNTMYPCRAQLCPRYKSAIPAQYALEVPIGFVREHGIKEGWNMEIKRDGDALQNL